MLARALALLLNAVLCTTTAGSRLRIVARDVRNHTAMTRVPLQQVVNVVLAKALAPHRNVVQNSGIVVLRNSIVLPNAKPLTDFA